MWDALSLGEESVELREPGEGGLQPTDEELKGAQEEELANQAQIEKNQAEQAATATVYFAVSGHTINAKDQSRGINPAE
jgi:hypothetical protein